MYDSCRSQVSQCMTSAGVKYVIMYVQQESSMTPAGVKNVHVLLLQESKYDSCRSQVCWYK